MNAGYRKQNLRRKLRAFCQTARLGSVTKAAEALCASQPTASLQIQALVPGDGDRPVRASWTPAQAHGGRRDPL
jgi:hypothetical protein